MDINKVLMQVNNTTLNLYVYDEISKSKIDWVNWCYVENEASADYFKKVLAENPNVSEINVFISSGGGSIKEALCIYNMLKRHPAKIHTYNDGFVCSAAGIIFEAGDTRTVSKGSNTLVHNASTYAEGNSADFRKNADELDTLTEQIKDIYMLTVKITRDELTALFDENRYMGVDEVMEKGFADEIAEYSASDKFKKDPDSNDGTGGTDNNGAGDDSDPQNVDNTLNHATNFDVGSLIKNYFNIKGE